MVERWREEVNDLTRAGQITAAQGETLREILLGVSHTLFLSGAPKE